MTEIVKTFGQRIKEFFSFKVTPIETLEGYQGNKELVKSLFDQDIIGIDEYIEQIKFLDDKIQEVIKKDTSSKQYADAIIFNVDGEILFLKRSSQDKFAPNTYGLPGGHIEKDETPEEAVKREVREETGKKVVECYQIAVKTLANGGKIYYFVCAVEGVDDFIVLDNDEHYSAQYIPTKDYDKYDFILDLKDTILQIQDKLKGNEITKALEKLEFITISNKDKLTSIKKLTDDKILSDTFFLQYIQAFNIAWSEDEEIEKSEKLEYKGYEINMIPLKHKLGMYSMNATFKGEYKAGIKGPSIKEEGIEFLKGVIDGEVKKAMQAGNTTGTDTTNQSLTIQPLKKEDIEKAEKTDKYKKDKQGGFIYTGDESLGKAKVADLITLPKDVKGTNCGNCKFMSNGFCNNENIQLPVTEKMCCSYWDSEGALRSWEEEKK